MKISLCVPQEGTSLIADIRLPTDEPQPHCLSERICLEIENKSAIKERHIGLEGYGGKNTRVAHLARGRRFGLSGLPCCSAFWYLWLTGFRFGIHQIRSSLSATNHRLFRLNKQHTRFPPSLATPYVNTIPPEDRTMPCFVATLLPQNSPMSDDVPSISRARADAQSLGWASIHGTGSVTSRQSDFWVKWQDGFVVSLVQCPSTVHVALSSSLRKLATP
jgi:hypothetical protein